MATWFSTKISFLKQAENGSIYKKSEQYLLNAESFTEAEAKLQAILEDSIPEYNLLTCAKANIAEIVFNEGAEAFYSCKISFLQEDADTGKEKKVTQTFLVAADTLREANELLEEHMKGTVVEWELLTVNKTTIVDVFADENEEGKGKGKKKKLAKAKEYED